MDDEALSNISGVPATMLVALAARSLARSVRPDMEFEDAYAEAIVDALDIDAAEYCTLLPSMLVTIYRSKFLDGVTSSFFRRHPDGLGVNLACGLGTNFDRVAAGLAPRSAWVDIDLPHVINIRRRFFVDTPQRSMVEGDVTSGGIIADLLDDDRPTLIVMEGLLYYLTGDEVAVLFESVARARDGHAGEVEVAFDFVSPAGLAFSAMNTDLQRSGAQFQWAFEGVDQVRRWDPTLRAVATGHHGEFIPDAMRPMFLDAIERDGIPPTGVIHFQRAT